MGRSSMRIKSLVFHFTLHMYILLNGVPVRDGPRGLLLHVCGLAQFDGDEGEVVYVVRPLLPAPPSATGTAVLLLGVL